MGLRWRNSEIPNGETIEEKLEYPVIPVFFIIFRGLCERISNHGMKTVLTLYLRDILLYNENESTIWYHLFAMLCYVTPIFGAILADTYLGNFKATVWISFFCTCGYVLLGLSSIPDTLTPQREFSILALFVIALGTGGIKPCVSAFGGEQFVRPQQDKQLEQYFSIFYFFTSAGGIVSLLTMPILREDVKCFNQNSCYPLAFGVPAIIMIVGLVIFYAGKKTYKIFDPTSNNMLNVVKCVVHAIGRKVNNKGEKQDHWLEFATDKFDKQFIKDIKQVLRVLLLYITIPIFWALYDQQGSRWTFQASRMDGNIKVTRIKADQLQILNPLLVLILVPLFESIIYPCFKKCGLLTPLQRIGGGGILALLAFVLSGVVELKLESTYPRIPGVGLTQLTFINTLPCQINVTYVNANQVKWTKINGTSYSVERDLVDQPVEVTAEIMGSTCGSMSLSALTWKGTIKGASEKGYSVIICRLNGKIELVRLTKEDALEKSNHGQPRLGFVLLIDKYDNLDVITVRIRERLVHFSLNSTSLTSVRHVLQTEERDVEAGTYDVFIPRENNGISKITLGPGGCYMVVVTPNYLNYQLSKQYDSYILMSIQMTPTNSVHMLWLFPQYFFMASAEVMLSVTGLQFSYTQSPISMRSVMQAAWLSTVGLGNLIVTIVSEALKENLEKSMGFFLFAGLMGIDMLLFFYLASRYTYVEDLNPKEYEERKVVGMEVVPLSKPVSENNESSVV